MPARPNTVKSKGGVPGAKTLPVAPSKARPTRSTVVTPRLIPEVVIEPATKRRVFYQVREPAQERDVPYESDEIC